MWQDMGMYWAWRGGQDGYSRPPSQKRLHYADVDNGAGHKYRLCIGVWDGEKYTPLHRREYARLIENR